MIVWVNEMKANTILWFIFHAVSTASHIIHTERRTRSRKQNPLSHQNPISYRFHIISSKDGLTHTRRIELKRFVAKIYIFDTFSTVADCTVYSVSGLEEANLCMVCDPYDHFVFSYVFTLLLAIAGECARVCVCLLYSCFIRSQPHITFFFGRIKNHLVFAHCCAWRESFSLFLLLCVLEKKSHTMHSWIYSHFLAWLSIYILYSIECLCVCWVVSVQEAEDIIL